MLRLHACDAVDAFLEPEELRRRDVGRKFVEVGARLMNLQDRSILKTTNLVSGNCKESEQRLSCSASSRAHNSAGQSDRRCAAVLGRCMHLCEWGGSPRTESRTDREQMGGQAASAVRMGGCSSLNEDVVTCSSRVLYVANRRAGEADGEATLAWTCGWTVHVGL